MKGNWSFTAIPSELELLEFFESEPVEAVPADGYWCYQYVDSDGVCVRLSCNIHEMSIQTVLLIKGNEIETVVQEGAREIRIIDDVLYGEFDLSHLGRLELRVRPKVSIRWSSLRRS